MTESFILVGLWRDLPLAAPLPWLSCSSLMAGDGPGTIQIDVPLDSPADFQLQGFSCGMHSRWFKASWDSSTLSSGWISWKEHVTTAPLLTGASCLQCACMKLQINTQSCCGAPFQVENWLGRIPLHIICELKWAEASVPWLGSLPAVSGLSEFLLPPSPPLPYWNDVVTGDHWFLLSTLLMKNSLLAPGSLYPLRQLQQLRYFRSKHARLGDVRLSEL